MTLKLTHLDKIYWEEEKISKGDLIKYYASISHTILPYLKDRPLVLHRYPEGISGQMFYQKDAGKTAPSFMKTFNLAHKNKTVSYLVVQNAKSLLYVANLGSIELHPFNSSIQSLDKPDYLAFDLDPEAISFDAVIETAQALHELCEEIKIPSYCKTSGATGLHIFLPLGAKYDYEQTRQFASILAEIINKRIPSITSLMRMPKKRQKKVYIDTLQNVKGQTLVCAYSVRGKPHAPVSTPLHWKEVKKGLDPLDFTIHTVPKRIAKVGDLFKGVLEKGINLQACLKRLEKMA